MATTTAARILLVEDESHSRHAMRDFLLSQHLHVDAAASLARAVPAQAFYPDPARCGTVACWPPPRA